MGGLSSSCAAVARAYACVVFAKRRVPGCLLLSATLLSPVSGLVTLWSVVVATVLAFQLGYARSAIERGHYGYNAVLLGLAVAHGRAFSFELLAVAALGGLASVLLTAVLSELFWRGAALPVLALPALLLLGLVQRWQQLHPLLLGGAPPPILAVTHSFGAEFDHVLRACGAILFDPSRAAGGLVLAAMLLYSRMSALLAVLGIAVAMLLTRALEVEPSGAVALAASYNGGLTAVAIGAALFVPGRSSMLVALLGAACAAFGSIVLSQTEPVFAVWAWPFVSCTLVALRALRLRGAAAGLTETLLPLGTPEQNRDHRAMLRARFGSLGHPQFVLPFTGKWFVSQGVNGEHTHQGPWAHALDFEVVDHEGFPFRGRGERLQDYYCYGRPALAPGSGTVVAVHDGASDQAPGSQDTARPWGNAVILQHGPELFSVLAHLQPGAMQVKVGDFVVAGQPLGHVGASGRSPRPHLHFQAQRTAELGAATLPFLLAGYGSTERGKGRYAAFGLPQEGAHVFNVERPSGAGILGLLPGMELQCLCDGVPLKVRYELSLLGEHSLLDVERGDRVYFVPGPVLTTYAGRPGTPLATLYWAMPCLPVPEELTISFRERLMPGGSLSLAWSALRSCAVLLGVPCELSSEGAVERTDSCLIVQTRTDLLLGKWVLASWDSSVRIGPRGLESISRASRRPRRGAQAPRELSLRKNGTASAIERTESCL